MHNNFIDNISGRNIRNTTSYLINSCNGSHKNYDGSYVESNVLFQDNLEIRWATCKLIELTTPTGLENITCVSSPAIQSRSSHWIRQH